MGLVGSVPPNQYLEALWLGPSLLTKKQNYINLTLDLKRTCEVYSIQKRQFNYYLGLSEDDLPECFFPQFSSAQMMF